MRGVLAGGLLAAVVTWPGASAGAASSELDPSFGAGGRASIQGPGVVQVHDLAVQPDGSVVVVGQVLDGGVVHALAARLTPDGRPDPSFGVRRPVGVAGVDEKAHAVAVQPDGRILVAGETGAGQDAAVWRLLPDGTPDPTFGDDGFAAVPDAGAKERADAVAVAPDGSVVVGGFTSNDSHGFVARMTVAGAPDTAFDGDGLRLLGSSNYYHDIRAVAVQPDGKVVATGGNSGTAGAPVYRLRTDGSDDPEFGSGGEVDVPGTVFDGRDLVLQADGRMVVLTQTLPAGSAREVPVLVRLDGAGHVDPTFGFGAGATLGVGGEFSQGQELVAHRGGFVAAVISVDRGPILVAADSDGKPDPEFGLAAPGGVVATGLGVQPTGGFVVAVNNKTGAEVDRLRGEARPVVVVVPTCHGRPATIVGTEGKDRLRGTAHDDVIVALGGNDVVRTSSGNDVVCGGEGDDRISGGSGRDRLYGEQGKDHLVGGSGKDRLVGGPGKDRLR